MESLKEILNKRKQQGFFSVDSINDPYLDDCKNCNQARLIIVNNETVPCNLCDKSFEDDRGLFAELMRTFSQGQTSYSITKKGEIRGNHFHTRKVERFSVIKGKAKIQLREVISDEKIEFLLDGSSPSYVDMPIWYTHNIKNIGDEILYTSFWINETYIQDDSDTYIEEV